MAQVRFLKPEDKPNKKNYKPAGTKIKFWKWLCFIQWLGILAWILHA